MWPIDSSFEESMKEQVFDDHDVGLLSFPGSPACRPGEMADHDLAVYPSSWRSREEMRLTVITKT